MLVFLFYFLFICMLTGSFSSGIHARLTLESMEGPYTRFKLAEECSFLGGGSKIIYISIHYE